MNTEQENNEEFNDTLSSRLWQINQTTGNRESSFRMLSQIWRKSRSCFCSGVILKGASFAVGLWEPQKGFRALMAGVFLVLDIYFFLQALFFSLFCRKFATPLNNVLCGNVTNLNTSSNVVVPPDLLQGLDLISVLSLVSCFARLMSNVTFFWCIWRLNQSVDCVTQQKAYMLASPSLWTSLNCVIIFFTSCFILKLVWYNLTLELKSFLNMAVSLDVIPQWTTLVTCWVFVVLANALENCVTQCHTEIKNVTHCSLNDIIRIHKRFSRQILNTSHSLQFWFMMQWFLFAITAVVYVADLVDFFQNNAVSWYFLYQSTLVSVVYLYVFVSPSYCAASVTAKCRQILLELNTTTDEDWDPGHPFHDRAQLALFIHYADFANCGFRVGKVTFGSNFAWFSTLVAMCGIGVKIL